MTCSLTRDDLDSFLDGELEPARQAEVQAHLAVCPDCAARLRGEQRVRERLAVLCADETAPIAFRDRVFVQVRSAGAEKPGLGWPSASPLLTRITFTRRPLLYGLAAAAMVAILAIVWTLSPRGGVESALAAGLAEDHSTHHGASEREGVFRSQDPAELERWFERQLGMSIDLPAAPAGARLVGGQVCLVGGRRVVHAVYDVNGATVSYFVVPNVSGPSRPTPGRVGDLNYVAWDSDPGGVYVLSSAPSSELMPFHL
jgi:mycothiol system anti-sigma-R factor